jgi:hypothetical protein
MDFSSHEVSSHFGGRFFRAAGRWIFFLLLATSGFSALPSSPPLSVVASAFRPENWNMRFAFLVDHGSTILLDGRRVEPRDIGDLLAREKPSERGRDFFALIYLGPPRAAREVRDRVRQLMELSKSNAWLHWNIMIHPASFDGQPDYSLTSFPNVLARLEQRAKALVGTWELIEAPANLAVMEILAFDGGSAASLRSVQIGFQDERHFDYLWRWKGEDPQNASLGRPDVNREVGTNASNYLLTIAGGGERIELHFAPDPKSGETLATVSFQDRTAVGEFPAFFEVGPYRRVDASPLPPLDPDGKIGPAIQYRQDWIFEKAK